MEKFSARVFSMRKVSRNAVVTSGISCMSDSAMPWKPRMEDPSKSGPLTKKSASTLVAGTLKCCWTPGRSVKRISTNFTSSSLMNLRTSSAVLNIYAPNAYVNIWHASHVVQRNPKAGRTQGFPCWYTCRGDLLETSHSLWIRHFPSVSALFRAGYRMPCYGNAIASPQCGPTPSTLWASPPAAGPVGLDGGRSQRHWLLAQRTGHRRRLQISGGAAGPAGVRRRLHCTGGTQDRRDLHRLGHCAPDQQLCLRRRLLGHPGGLRR